jgi:putative NADH-flavin reductase
MKVAVIGASGIRGGAIVAELLSRGHEVTGIARNPEKIPAKPKLAARKGDVDDQAGLARLLAGHDAVVSSVRFAGPDPAKLLAAVKASGVKRYLVVGGAGSLEVKPGLRLIDTPEFPAAYKAEAAAGGAYLKLLEGENELEWSFLSPSAIIGEGPRTGKFRLGTDQLLVGSDGKSFISNEDYAIAMVDEIERRQHIRKRFTVGY